ncbi:hypothetical protein GOP47_0018204 [Adiantum capillus-veneris]|uniref:Pentatricopeptide repeat-containing protein n=1 Tax=Adiantum capillus-veneris TaxID=13818 RepID=A0A9D4ZCJ5_ADICA|nr:hypothetical protein GOP47_0018204 [Adiantum capillus-veneris]
MNMPAAGPNRKAAINWEVLTLEEALESLDPFASELSVDVLICVSHKCRKRRDLAKAHQLLGFVSRNGLETQGPLGNHLVPMLVECGSIASAREIFERSIYPNVHAWTSLISGYVQGGFYKHAWNLYRRMQASCVCINSYTLVALLKASLNLKEVQEAHLEIVEKGFENDLFVGSTLVDSYVKCGGLSEAHGVFSQMPVRSVVSWTALIAGYADNGLSEEAVDCYEQMQKQGFLPNEVTLICILKACATLRALVKGEEVHTDICQKGYCNPLLESTLVDMYAKCGSHLEAYAVLKKLSVQDVVAWNALIAGYVEYELGQEALTCFEQMQDGDVPVDAFTAVCVLKACGDTGASDKGFDVHTEIILKSFESDPFVGNTLVDMYGKCGLLVEARKVFDGLEVKDLVSWNAMLRGYGANYEGTKTLQLFECMQEHGMKPDAMTFTSVLSACSHVNCAQRGLDLFKLMSIDYAIIPTIDHFTCVVDLLARSGQLHEAEKLLGSMTGAQSKEMWLALLSACKSCSELDLGLNCFQHLIKIDPECSTPYMLMANMYANAGRWQEACKIEDFQRKICSEMGASCEFHSLVMNK